MLKGINTKIVAITAVLMAAGITTVQAEEGNSVNENQVIKAVQHEGNISRIDAKKIMRKYLKSNKSYKKLRVGAIKKTDNTWSVKLTSNRIPISTAYVNDKTGEITFKR